MASSARLFFSLSNFSTFCYEGFLSHEGIFTFFMLCNFSLVILVLFLLSQAIKGTKREYVLPVPVGLSMIANLTLPFYKV